MNLSETIGTPVLTKHPLAPYTTWGIGGPAEFYVEIHNLETLLKLVQTAQTRRENIFILGAGSNILIDDAGLAGWTVRLKGEFEKLSFEKASEREKREIQTFSPGKCDDSAGAGTRVKADAGELFDAQIMREEFAFVRAGAGVFLPHLVRRCAEQSLGGIEPLVGVPGNVGGALRMNAGTREREIGQVVESAQVLNLNTLEVQTLTPEQMGFSYRHSRIENGIVLCAVLRLQRKDKTEILNTVQSFLSRRLKTQPVGSKNCGSVFKNPKGDFAAALIEKAGLKGFQIGGAQVSEKHANFIVNTGSATAADVKRLISHIQETVRQKFNVALEREVKYIP